MIARRHKLKTIIIVMTVTLLLSVSAYAKTVSWQNAAESFKKSGPVGQKLYIWLNITQGGNSFNYKTLVNFIKSTPEWPQLYKFRGTMEEDLASLSNYTDLELWFDKELPKTYEGIDSYTSYLLTIKKPEKAREVIKKFWIDARLNKKEVKSLHKKYSQLITYEDDVKRLDNLIWKDRYNEAEVMLRYVDENIQKVAQARVALLRGYPEANSLVDGLSMQERKEPGIVYGRVRWRRIKDNTEEAIDMLRLQPKNLPSEELWWEERNILSRRKIEDGEYNEAYNLISKHGLKHGSESYAQAEWLLGWISLRFLNQPSAAYPHFENFYQSVNSAISSSRAAYWLGRADEALNNKESAKNWYQLAAQFPSTFYGQLASEKVYGDYNPAMFFNDNVSKKAASDFKRNELVQAIKLLSKHKLTQFIDTFFVRLFLNAKTRTDYILIAQLAEEINQTRYAVEANKRLQQNLGTFMFNTGYPHLSSKTHKEADKALVHSIVYRESMFDKNAISSAGARGLMQLMPATAKSMSKKSKAAKGKFNPNNLTTNPDYNVKLGSVYIEQLVEDYDGFYPMAIAAYNAGPRNVSKWVKSFGDPRKKDVDVIDWLELIPIYETRHYVQRVMETYYIYRLKFSEKPKTVVDFL